AYFIPAGDYASGDTVGLPYATTSRTRLNGLDANGISFINTGRGRDLGAALVALDTRGPAAATGVWMRWLWGTILQNTRVYALRAQYRVGASGPFQDLTEGGSPVEYVAHGDGDTQAILPIALPADAIGKPNVQILWRYY